MGSCEKKVSVKESAEYAGLCTLLLGIVAEIQPLLADEDLALQRGAVLYAEDGEDYEKMMRIFQGIGAVVCKNLGKIKPNVANNRMGIHPYKAYDHEDELDKFLENEGFTPAVATFKFIPDFMKRYEIFVFRGGFDKDGVAAKFRLFQAFAHQNPDIIQREIRRFKTSKRYLECQTKNSLTRAFEASAYVYGSFYRERHDEKDTETLIKYLRRAIVFSKEIAESYSEECDVAAAVKKAIEQYVDANQELMICKIDEVDGKAQRALQEREIILLDDEWYYLSDEILRLACEDMLPLVSIPSIKNELWRKGFLWCNATTEKNYTVKKVLTNVFGHTYRMRFLKIRRDFFVSCNSLGLEERRQNVYRQL